MLVRDVLEPPTDLQLAGRDRRDSVDLEIFLHKLDSIIDDGRDVCKYLSMAEMLQAGDLGVGVFTARGDLAGMSTGVILHALLHYGPVKYVLKHTPTTRRSGSRTATSSSSTTPTVAASIRTTTS